LIGAVSVGPVGFDRDHVEAALLDQPTGDVGANAVELASAVRRLADEHDGGRRVDRVEHELARVVRVQRDPMLTHELDERRVVHETDDAIMVPARAGLKTRC